MERGNRAEGWSGNSNEIVLVITESGVPLNFSGHFAHSYFIRLFFLSIELARLLPGVVELGPAIGVIGSGLPLS